MTALAIPPIASTYHRHHRCRRAPPLPPPPTQLIVVLELSLAAAPPRSIAQLRPSVDERVTQNSRSTGGGDPNGGEGDGGAAPGEDGEDDATAGTQRYAEEAGDTDLRGSNVGGDGSYDSSGFGRSGRDHQLGKGGDGLAHPGAEDEVAGVLGATGLTPRSCVSTPPLLLNPIASSPTSASQRFEFATPLRWAGDQFTAHRRIEFAAKNCRQTRLICVDPATNTAAQAITVGALSCPCIAGVDDRRAPQISDGKKRTAGLVDKVGEEDDSASREYYGQLWAKDLDPISSPVLVWIRRDLVSSCSFTAADCYPDATVDPAARATPISLTGADLELREKIRNMADQGRGRGRGRGGNPRGNKQGGQSGGDHGGASAGNWPQFDPQFGPPPPQFQYGFGFAGAPQIPPPWYPGAYSPSPPQMNQWRGPPGGWGRAKPRLRAV